MENSESKATPSNELTFETFEGEINLQHNETLSSNLTMTKGSGNVVINKVELLSDLTDDKGNIYSHIKVIFGAEDGGGAIDTISTKTGSQFQLCLERVKYLFKYFGEEMPRLDAFVQPIQGQASEIGTIVNDALRAYCKDGAKLSDVAKIGKAINADGEEVHVIVFTSKSAFDAVMGSDPATGYRYASLASVRKLRSEHRSEINKAQYTPVAEKMTEEAIELGTEGEDYFASSEIKQELMKALRDQYHADLDAQPVIPCFIDSDEVTKLFEAIDALDKEDTEVFINTKENKTQVQRYSPAK